MHGAGVRGHQCSNRTPSSSSSSSRTRLSISASWLQRTMRAMILILDSGTGVSGEARPRSMPISRNGAGTTPAVSRKAVMPMDSVPSWLDALAV
ncbi:hypothetical protein G6F50_017688 [Rhizopus delemar]|uniref:Uncharacterized protein n=1 Tax=Rhizopus delemar TaxID=936053 RepID=A0A9P7BZE8_9FUNG|nr:hypothetical protein G6F50_017688 [Rhizopus delemar]